MVGLVEQNKVHGTEDGGIGLIPRTRVKTAADCRHSWLPGCVYPMAESELAPEHELRLYREVPSQTPRPPDYPKLPKQDIARPPHKLISPRPASPKIR
ncbi:MAG: hypothetical protein DMF75_04585 [Acidobacteria bacterium]|nr:MAG: hypothetical protein DMF75_04585 [Acidobacteriota bacterium]